MNHSALPPTKSRLIVKRDGHAITSKVPRPVILIDTREQDPFSFKSYPNWISGEKKATLKTGDYSVVGMEDILVLERKSLNDIVSTLAHNRTRFFNECERMTQFRHKAIIIEASYQDLKSPYTFFSGVEAHPNGIVGSLDALEARYNIPIIYTSQHKDLAQEKAASWMSKLFTYYWLETNGLGRVLQEGDL